jgi:WS/DGAT/MGAT family acyltransferase
MRRLAGVDALFLYNETPTQHMHTLKVAIIDPSENPEGYSFEHEKEKLASRLHLVPPFRWKVVPTPLALHHPLVAETEVDLDYHMRRAAVPSPGGDRELGELISEIASRPLDRSHPLWEMWMIEGLAGGRVASVSKIHHTLADGVASVELLNQLLTHEPGEEVPHDAPAWAPEAVPGPLERLRLALRDLARFLPRYAVKVARAARGAHRRHAASLARHALQPPAPGSGPDVPWNRVISAQRRFAFAALPMEQARAVREATGATINDVVVAAIAGAMRRWLLRRGQLPAVPLVGQIPVSTRAPEERRSWGNRVTAIYVAVHAEIGDAMERLRATQRATQAAKAELEDTRGARLSDWLELFPPFVSQLVFSRLPTWMKRWGRPSLASLTISNVPGPREPLFYGGSRLAAFYSVGPVLEGIGLNVTVWSYVDQLAFGVLTCRNAVSDPWELTADIRASLEELAKAATAAAPRPVMPQEVPA